MASKSEEDLALADKIDLARTIVRYKHRRLAIRELNEAEEAIAKRHKKEVESGSFSEIDLDSIGLTSITGPKELDQGAKNAKDSN